MTQILVNCVGWVIFHDSLVRIECLSIILDGKVQPTGTLLMSGAQGGKALSVVKSLQGLQKKVPTSGTMGRA